MNLDELINKLQAQRNEHGGKIKVFVPDEHSGDGKREPDPSLYEPLYDWEDDEQSIIL